MLNKFSMTSQSIRLVTIIIILIGIALRITVLAQNRSLRIDEANVALNIVEKDYGDFFQPLDYQQYAPPLFMCITEASTRLFGMNETGLKFPAFLAALISLIFLFLILDQTVDEYPARWYILLLFAFSILAIRYGTEVKQYAVDLLLALVMVYGAIKFEVDSFNQKKAVIWLLVGSVFIWLSMPIVFVLGAIGCQWLIHSIRNNKAHLKWIMLPGLGWLLSFLVYFNLILYEDSTGQNLKDYHGKFFFELIPSSWEVFQNNLKLIRSLFRLSFDQTFIPLIWGMIMYIIGTVILIRKNSKLALLLTLPIIFTIITSHFELYSLIDRMVLFLVPFILIVAGIGISWAWKQSSTLVRWLMTGVMVLSLINSKGYEYFWQKMEFEDTKGVMSFLEQHREPDEPVYVHHQGVPAFRFYNSYYDRAWNFESYYLATWDEYPENVIPQLFNSTSSQRFWLFFSHSYPQKVVDQNVGSMEKAYDQINFYKSIEASAYQFEKRVEE